MHQLTARRLPVLRAVARVSGGAATRFGRRSLSPSVRSEPGRGERVALTGVAAVDSALEPAHALRRASVGERLGDDTPLRLALQAVVADGGRGVETLLDVAGLEDLAGALGVVRPHAGQAIGLELHAHLERVGLGRATTALRRADALGDPEQILDVVPD